MLVWGLLLDKEEKQESKKKERVKQDKEEKQGGKDRNHLRCVKKVGRRGGKKSQVVTTFLATLSLLTETRWALQSNTIRGNRLKPDFKKSPQMINRKMNKDLSPTNMSMSTPLKCLLLFIQGKCF